MPNSVLQCCSTTETAAAERAHPAVLPLKCCDDSGPNIAAAVLSHQRPLAASVHLFADAQKVKKFDFFRKFSLGCLDKQGLYLKKGNLLLRAYCPNFKEKCCFINK